VNATTPTIATGYYPQYVAPGAAQQTAPGVVPPMAHVAAPLQGLVSCRSCSHPHQVEAKFCGNCGNSTAMQAQSAPLEAIDTRPHQAPKFAHITHTEIPKELLQELGDLLVVLIRERLFLYFHCTAFVVLTIAGIWLTFKVYNGFTGDEVTRVILALTPMLFINCCALGIIAPIMGTKREIQKLKYRLLLVRHRIEYRAIL
jgi:hypothetical protein